MQIGERLGQHEPSRVDEADDVDEALDFVEIVG